MKNGMHMTKDKVKLITDGLKKLPGRSALVGIPETEASRDDDSPITNPALGYIHEHGAPEVNLPARPWLVPGIRRAKGKIAKHLGLAAKAAMGGNKTLVERHLHAAGMVGAASAMAVIRDGLQPPLADSTLRGRARRKKGSGVRLGKGALKELRARARGAAPSTAFAKPLIDTSQLLHSITYVLRG